MKLGHHLSSKGIVKRRSQNRHIPPRKNIKGNSKWMKGLEALLMKRDSKSYEKGFGPDLQDTIHPNRPRSNSTVLHKARTKKVII